MNVKAVPEGYHSVTPYAVVEGADQMIQFLKTVFGAEEAVRLPGLRPTSRMSVRR